MRVKGTAIIDLVRIIRAEKGRDWDKYLQDPDHELIKSIVLPGSYYPGDSFWRISWAVAKEIGGGTLENAFLFGRASAKSYLAVYKNLVVGGDPAKTVANFVDIWETFYDCEGAEYRRMQLEIGANHLRVVAHDYPDMTIPEVRKPYFHGLAGYFQEIIERVSGKAVKNTVNDRGDSFELTFLW